MDDDEDGPVDPPDAPAGAIWPVVPPLPPEVHEGTEEVRRLVDAGAASPEELRALAAKLRERRETEAALWRQEVKPALIKSKKWRSRNREAVGETTPPEERAASNLRIGLAILGGVLILILAASQGSFLIVLLPVVVVLVVAYRQGTQADAATDDAAENPPD